MGMFITVNGLRIESKAEESLNMPTVTNTRASGETTCPRDKAPCTMPMATSTRASGSGAQKMAKVLSSLALGKLCLTSGEVYTGEWVDNIRNGKGKCREHKVGVCSYATGDKYDGEWVSDKKTGKGIRSSQHCRNDAVPQQRQVHRQVEGGLQKRAG
eukprot:TRINITY_DN3434_c0_g1_i1.p2 TRINITY_DN3434_c0_g1~~TRINITY_DN3434_c0_g1_i1.p2  ORF type:complete len:157 (+),score=1.07 TRINITY_DN3434_c0_g1_i1:206-676(+)